MNVRHFVAASLVAALAVLAVGATGASGGEAANTLTVWLQTDAQQNAEWEKIVKAANATFERQHPGWNVDVQYKTWNDHLANFDSALAARNAPDVKEMGNSQMMKYMVAGAFQDLSSLRSKLPNSRTWLEGLAGSGRYNGKLYGVPYYAGSRVVTYRTDLFKKAKVKVPTSLAEFEAAARKIGAQNKGKGFSPVYIAGPDWYVAMGFVYDYGGQIAVQSKGKWIATLDRPKALAGLAAYKRFFNAASRASKTQDEAHPFPYTVYAQGRVAAMPGQSWVTCCIGKYKNVSSQFVMPSHVKGQPMPGFLGGSNLGVPVGGNRELAVDWIAAYTSNQSMTDLRALGNIPNTTSLLGNSVVERAARKSWFVPSAKNWVNVESGNILRTMLSRILTNKMTVKQAAEVASDNIAFTLNQQ